MDAKTKKIIYWVLIVSAVGLFVGGWIAGQTGAASLIAVLLLLVASFCFGPRRKRSGGGGLKSLWHNGNDSE